MEKVAKTASTGGKIISEDGAEERADRREEIERMRESGYSAAEIAALLSTDRWSGYSSY